MVSLQCWVEFLLYCKVTQLCIYIYSLSYFFHYGLLQDVEYSFLCCTVGLYGLSILYIKLPIPSSPTPTPLATTSLFSIFVNPFYYFLLDMFICVRILGSNLFFNAQYSRINKKLIPAPWMLYLLPATKDDQSWVNLDFCISHFCEMVIFSRWGCDLKLDNLKM